MKFVCEHCQTRYSIADEKVQNKVLRIRCKTCQKVITVDPEAGKGAAAGAIRGDARPGQGAPGGRAAVKLASSSVPPSAKLPAPTPTAPLTRAAMSKSLAVPGRPAIPASDEATEVTGLAGVPTAKTTARPQTTALPGMRSAHASAPPAAARGPGGPGARAAAAAPAPPAAAVPSVQRGGAASSPPVPPLPRPGRADRLEKPEWHFAIDGKQEGPVRLAALAARLRGAGAEAEVYVWREGMPEWEAPDAVPEVADRLRELRQASVGAGPVATPPTPPPLVRGRAPARAASAVPPAPAAARLRGPAPGARPGEPGDAPPAVEGFDDGPPTEVGGKPSFTGELGETLGSDLLEEESGADATQISPFSPPAATPTPVVAMAPVATAPASVPAGGISVAQAFAANQSMPFFPMPSPAAAGPLPSAGAPLTGGPPPAESGLSKLLGVGGIFIRRPYLKFVAGGAALLVLFGSVALAVFGGSGGADASRGSAPPPEREPAVAPVGEDPEVAARREAERWFAAKGGDDAVRKATVTGPAHTAVAGRAAGRVVKRPGAEEQLPDVQPPSAVTPPPVEPGAAAPERPVLPAARPIARQPERAVPKLGGGDAAGVPSAEQQQKIREVVSSKTSQDAVKSCYSRILRSTGSTEGGRLDVVVSVQKTGRVSSVQISSPDGLKPLHGCIKTAVGAWRFPAGPEDYATRFTLLMQSS